MYQYKKIFGAVFAAIALSASVFAKEPPLKKNVLSVTYIDVGQGDSILIETPEGKNILIDAGNGPTEWSSFDAGAGIIVPFLKKRGIKKLDYMIMSHPHNDHIGGLPSVLKVIPVDTFVDPGFQYGSYVYENLLELVEEKGCEYVEARAGDKIVLDKYCYFKVFNPPRDRYFRGGSEPNENSLELKLIYKDVSFFFTGDGEKQSERFMMQNFKKELVCTVLKVAHHGSTSSTTQEFMDWAQPLYAVICVGAKNRFGHPKKATLKRLQDYGCKIFRTDRDGSIRITTDGKRYSAELLKESKKSGEKSNE
ncbi:MAG: MBL fold metallo-hydrolase [Elusimicrobia bacterium HGW-Elusimicrobia-2]|nr:MAG: MBL fold metallo-hydrolase [Elusimicrobia bacterium HGW-Elusimicrobia-2]